MKKISIITLLIGIILLLLGSLLPSDSIMKLLLLLFGGAIALSGLFALIFTKTVDENCYAETSIVALALSADVGLGFYSVILCLSCSFLSHPDNHPIRLLGGILIGLIAFALFIILLYYYTQLRKESPSKKGVLIDILFSFTFIAPFFFLFIEVGERISNLI